MTLDTHWSTQYPTYNANTLHLKGVISPETLHRYKFPDWVSPIQQEKMRAHILKNKCTWVREEHPVMDIVRNTGFYSQLEAYNVDQSGWYRIDNAFFKHCIQEILKNRAN